MFSMPFDSVAQGFALSFGLIVAIGAQNAFVLRQGLRREHIVSVVLFCAAVDAALITAGVLGMAEIIGRNVFITRALAACGAIFLLIYGWVALRRAMSPGRLEAARGGEALSYTAALLQVAAFTLLNPHVYLDTLLLVGSIGAQHPDSLRGWFILGKMKMLKNNVVARMSAASSSTECHPTITISVTPINIIARLLPTIGKPKTNSF